MIMQADTMETEEWLKSLFNEITFLERGKGYGTFEVRFRNCEKGKRKSTEILKKGDWVLLLLYMGWRTSKVMLRSSYGKIGNSGDLQSEI